MTKNPKKLTMEPKNEGLEDDVHSQRGDFSGEPVNHVSFRGGKNPFVKAFFNFLWFETWHLKGFNSHQDFPSVQQSLMSQSEGTKMNV